MSIEELDVFIGKKFKRRRRECGYSQKDLADFLGVTPQQVQKYETGFNRIGASRLYQIALMLGVPIEYFFDGFSENPRKHQEIPAEDTVPLSFYRDFKKLPSKLQSQIALLVRGVTQHNDTEEQRLGSITGVGGLNYERNTKKTAQKKSSD